MQQIHLNHEDIEAIANFASKYPDSEVITITADSSSGIGSIIKVSVPTYINDDHVVVEKTIADESRW
jgi:hypothetical protein